MSDPLGGRMKQLHDAANLATNAHSLDHPTDVFCYFARLSLDLKSLDVCHQDCRRADGDDASAVL